MSISADILASFPKLPETIYTSTPIYLEPIGFSGERITVLLVVSSPEIVIHRTIRKETIESMFGSKAASFTGMVDLCVKSIEIHLGKNKPMEQWKPPITGCHVGKPLSEHAHSSADTLRMGTRTYSCMGFLPGQADFEEELVQERRDRWPDLVEAALFEKRPALVKNLHQKFKVSPRSRDTSIDYIGDRYVANLGKLDPGQNFSNAIRIAKSKLWDIESLRDSRVGLIDDRVNDFELIVWRPDYDSPAYSDRQILNLKEALAELEDEGDKRELRIFATTGQALAADRIVMKEAA